MKPSEIELLSNEEVIWFNEAKENGYLFLVIAKDLEDKDMFPVFFLTKKELETYQNNIISESKIKILKVIEL